MFLKRNIGYCTKLQYVDDRGCAENTLVKLVVLTTKGVLFTAAYLMDEMQEDADYNLCPTAYFNATVNGRSYSGRIARTIYTCLLHQAKFGNIDGGANAFGFYEPNDENILANYKSQLFDSYVEQLRGLQKIILDHYKYYSAKS